MHIYFLCCGFSKHESDAWMRGESAYTDPENLDAPLTRAGRRQCYQWARKNAAFVPKWDIVFTSSMTRCLETTHEVLREIPGETPIVTDFLLERQGGGRTCNQRRSRDDLQFEWPTYEFMIPKEPLLHYANEPETKERMVYRLKFIVDLVRRMEGKNALIVSHPEVLEAYLGRALLPGEGYVFNTSLS